MDTDQRALTTSLNWEKEKFREGTESAEELVEVDQLADERVLLSLTSRRVTVTDAKGKALLIIM